MTTKEKILEIVKLNNNLSAREIGKLVGTNRSNVNKHLKSLQIPRDRKLLQKLNNTKRSFEFNISENLHQIILGSILGDGFISRITRSNDSKLNLNSKLCIKHSLIQKDYAKYKAYLLSNEGIKVHIKENPPRKKVNMLNGRIVKDNGSIEVNTQRTISLNKYRELFYKEIKVIDDLVFDLNALGLAIWFMDDGTKHVSSYYLSTQSFIFEENVKLVELLDKNFGIKAKIHKAKNLYNLYISTKSRELFTKTIENFICESMKYKLHRTS